VTTAAVLAVLRSPRLWPTALRQARRLAAPGWWRRRPFLPVPPVTYRHFRLVTQYGDHAPREISSRELGRDVVNYLSWCRQWEHGR
jgi:hypothetical protein